MSIRRRIDVEMTLCAYGEDNPSEEAISESCKIKEQHETIKLLKKEVRILQQKHLKP